jgi:glycosyltransferase involved in cell wall biosynthesis
VTVVVNGRFLSGTPTGLHRVGRSLLDAARRAGLDAEVVAPAGTSDARVDRTLPSPPGVVGTLVWEQLALPLYARRRTTLSLTNTAPVAAIDGVVLVHDLATLVGPHWFAPRMRAYGRVSLAAARRARLVLTVSNAVADELRGRGVRAPVHVVANAVDDTMRPAAPAALRRALDDLEVQPPYVLFVGWADPRKDVVTAVAAHQLATSSAPHQLVLTGLPHPNFAPLSVPQLPGVRHLGYVDDDRMRALLTGAAALVYPSRYEGFGLPPLEAWVCGTPALVSDIPVLRESTQNRAVYVAPGDVRAWAAAIEAAVRGELTAPAPLTRTWDDAGAELVSALRAGG